MLLISIYVVCFSNDDRYNRLLSQFWQPYKQHALNIRQVHMLNILLTGFYGRLTTEKSGLIDKCLIDTALRDIKDLIDKDMLKKYDAFKCCTTYELDM